MFNITKNGLGAIGKELGVISNNSTIIKINNISDHLYIGNCALLKKMFDIKFRNKINLLKE